MGKGGRGNKKPTVTKTDDELLDEAAATNRAAVAAALAESAGQMTLEDGCPTKAELLTALDSITLFDLRSAEDGDGKGRAPCLSPAGEFVFYVDENDAVEAMEARKRTNPGRVALGCTGLGRAFALSEGLAFGFSSSAKFPMRLQGSSATIKAIGDAAKRLCPPTLRKQLNERTGTLPMLSLQELIEGTDEAPYFFSHADLVEHWTSKTGKKAEAFPCVNTPHVARLPWQWPSSFPAPPQGAPGGSGRLGIPTGRGRVTGRPASASGARASCLHKVADPTPPTTAFWPLPLTAQEFPTRLVLTDLRVLIVRMMQVPRDWQTIKLVPSATSVAWLRAVTANQNAHNAMAETPKPAPKQADAPPPLQDDCPPLV